MLDHLSLYVFIARRTTSTERSTDIQTVRKRKENAQSRIFSYGAILPLLENAIYIIYILRNLSFLGMP